MDGADGSKAGIGRSTAIVLVLVAALLAGAIGVAIGWKVEQQRVKDDIANIRPIGTVTAVADDAITVDLQTTDEDRTYQVGSQTRVDSPEGGDLASVVEGTVVLVRSKRAGNGDLEATQIIVLPESAGRRG